MRALPLLPAGDCLFSNLPARAIVLDALAPALADGIITLVDGESTAVLVVRDGAIADAVAVAIGARETGEAAMVLVRGWESASVSCSRLSFEAMSLIDPLLHGEVVYSDLRVEWTAWSELLLDLRARGQTFVVELLTPNDRGVTVIRDGEHVATYTESQPTPGGTDVLDRLAAGGEGSIRVFAQAASPNRVMQSPPEPHGVAVAVATRVSVPTPHMATLATAAPPASDDDANATLSSLFGEPYAPQPFEPRVLPDRSGPLLGGGIELAGTGAQAARPATAATLFDACRGCS